MRKKYCPVEGCGRPLVNDGVHEWCPDPHCDYLAYVYGKSNEEDRS